MIPITEAVKHLLILNILVFLGTTTLMNEDRYVLALFYPESPFFHPWQLVTHMFMHANLSHLMFNMLSLFFIGPMMENSLGTKRFVTFFAVCGFGGALLHLAFKWYQIQINGDYSQMNVPALGASGAINGLFVGLAYLFPNIELYLMLIPFPIKAKYLAIFTLAADLLWGLSGQSTGIAHFAHLGGALFGFLLLLYWTRKR
ncbi:MAG: rhomboid family intramembrane serine protease [Saprospiraceae bacterium]|nr:rhomboid family intramembrane serine protease [Candidatus Vicinibacter affinis]